MMQHRSAPGLEAEVQVLSFCWALHAGALSQN